MPIRILHIVNEAGDPPVSGADWRNHSIGVALARLGRVESMAVGPLLDGAARTARRATVVRAIPDDVCAIVAARARALAPELTVLDGVALFAVAERLARERIGGALVFNTHNVESALLAENDLARTPALLRPLARLWFRPRWRRARAAESAMAGLSAGVLVCSDDDRRRLAAIAPGARIAVAPNAELRRMAALCPGATLAADPVDLDDIYRGAALSIMPIDQGGGTRLKALEALARGVAVVATGKAVEGLGLIDGEHYLRAESDAEFAAAAGRLFDDMARAARLAAAGRRYVDAHFIQEKVDAAVAAAIAEFAPELAL